MDFLPAQSSVNDMTGITRLRVDEISQDAERGLQVT